MLRRRRPSRKSAAPMLAAVAVAAAALAGLLGRHRVAGVASSARRRLTRRRGPGQDTFRCACGQPYRVSGTGRHRIYWPEGADAADPLMTPECVNCERALPTR